MEYVDERFSLWKRFIEVADLLIDSTGDCGNYFRFLIFWKYSDIASQYYCVYVVFQCEFLRVFIFFNWCLFFMISLANCLQKLIGGIVSAYYTFVLLCFMYR